MRERKAVVKVRVDPERAMVDGGWGRGQVGPRMKVWAFYYALCALGNGSVTVVCWEHGCHIQSKQLLGDDTNP